MYAKPKTVTDRNNETKKGMRDAPQNQIVWSLEESEVRMTGWTRKMRIIIKKYLLRTWKSLDKNTCCLPNWAHMIWSNAFGKLSRARVTAGPPTNCDLGLRSHHGRTCMQVKDGRLTEWFSICNQHLCLPGLLDPTLDRTIIVTWQYMFHCLQVILLDLEVCWLSNQWRAPTARQVPLLPHLLAAQAKDVLWMGGMGFVKNYLLKPDIILKYLSWEQLGYKVQYSVSYFQSIINRNRYKHVWWIKSLQWYHHTKPYHTGRPVL